MNVTVTALDGVPRELIDYHSCEAANPLQDPKPRKIKVGRKIGQKWVFWDPESRSKRRSKSRFLSTKTPFDLLFDLFFDLLSGSPENLLLTYFSTYFDFFRGFGPCRGFAASQYHSRLQLQLLISVDLLHHCTAGLGLF